MKVACQILGMILLVLGGQGAVRLLVDHDDGGLLSWMGGGFPGQLAGHLVLGAGGLLLAAWAARQPSSSP